MFYERRSTMGQQWTLFRLFLLLPNNNRLVITFINKTASSRTIKAWMMMCSVGIRTQDDMRRLIQGDLNNINF